MNLLQIKDNEYAIIVRLPGGEAGLRLEALGLREGKRVHKVSGMPWGGPVTLKLDGRHFAIGHNIAARVEVTPALPLARPDASETQKNKNEL